MSKNLFVFDVESIGLYGEGFAVGYVVTTRERKLIEEGCFACDLDRAIGLDEESRQWIGKNVKIPMYDCVAPWIVREKFWEVLLRYRDTCLFFADCCYPVETNFLAACVKIDSPGRQWLAPYPLYDIAIIRAALGFDPLTTLPRLENELPKHNPLADARQSARILLDIFDNSEFGGGLL
jgi:hypothetical protein